MDKIGKLFRKINPQNKSHLLNIIEKLLNGDKNLDIKKLKNSNYYRLRFGKFRIFFYYNDENQIIIEGIKQRNENTYKKN